MKKDTMEELFRPPNAQWHPLSPSYLTLKLLMIGINWAIIGAIIIVPLVLLDFTWWWAALIAFLVFWAWRFLRAPRVFRRWGYAETDDDIYLTRGLLWRELTCVPYGRMQLVNVSSGPIERQFGLASVELVTSSTSGTITIPGLARPDAIAMRDRLIERGELLQAGI